MRKLYTSLTALAFVFALLVPATLQAQNSNILYGSSRTPQMNSVNPAFFPSKSQFYIALPGANIDFTSPLAYSSIFNYQEGDSVTTIDINKLMDSLSNDGRFRLAANVHAVGLGLRFGSSFITLSSQAKIITNIGLPNGLLTFLNEGNYGYTGDNYLELLDGQLLTMRAYGEIALGYGREIGNLTIGARAKLLVGYFDLSTEGSSLRLYTADDYSSIRADLDLNIHNTSAIEILTDENGKRSYNINYLPQNMGINFDLGARYETDLFDFSASIIDLGPGIHWTENVKQYVTAGGSNSFTFSGLNVDSLLVNGQMDTTFTRTLVDSLKTMLDFDTIDGEAYWTAIPTKINLGGMFKLTPSISAGILFHGEFDRGLTRVGDAFKMRTTGFYSNTSVLARFNLRDWIEIVGSMSIVTNNSQVSWINPGFGVTLTPLRAIQLYLVMDYISNRYIVDAKQFNLTAGINFLFGSQRD